MLAFLLYFLAIGAGYILVEVGLIQKFVLFLGHPTYALCALAVVITARKRRITWGSRLTAMSG